MAWFFSNLAKKEKKEPIATNSIISVTCGALSQKDFSLWFIQDKLIKRKPSPIFISLDSLFCFYSDHNGAFLFVSLSLGQ